MMDLTKNIILEPKANRNYKIARILLYLAFLGGALFTFDRILFPTASLGFSFANINSLKNTLVAPQISSTGLLPEKGVINKKEAMMFNANPIGNFSDASVTFSLKKNNTDIAGTEISIRKSYQAFFYPTGSPAGFKDGTLLTSDGKYYIISNSKLRKFANPDIVSQLGYPKNSFLSVSDSDLAFNSKGDNISDAKAYPDDTYFVVGEDYYQLRNQQLFPFVSKRAFLSQADSSMAIPFSSEFLGHYPIQETSLVFVDGTLASSGDSVFILSDGKSYPIDNADTFSIMGYNWDDVIALDPEELGLYERQKQFTRNQPHPKGTIFFDQKNDSYFIIADGEKHPLESPLIANTYVRQSPIIVNSQSLEKRSSCLLKKNIIGSDTYSCAMPLSELLDFPGGNYQIAATFGVKTDLQDINMKFYTPLSWKNLRTSLSRIKTNLQSNYSN